MNTEIEARVKRKYVRKKPLAPRGFQVGSRRGAIASLKVGESALFEAKPGKGSVLQQMIGGDLSRLGVKARQQIFLAVSLSLPREVMEVVKVTRI